MAIFGVKPDSLADKFKGRFFAIPTEIEIHEFF